MLVLAIAVAVALILPAVTGGSYTRLIMTDWRWSPLLFAGLGLQVVLEFDTIPKSRWDDVGYGLLMLSYALIIGFCARNLLLKGMVIVLIGVCCNTLVIAFDRGMPVHLPPDLAKEQAFEPTVKHHPQDASDRLTVLGDRIVLRSPFDTALSFGDLIIAVGLWPYMITVPLLRSMAPKTALDLMMTVRRVDAYEGARLGFVQRVVAVDDLDATVDALAAELATKSPLIMHWGRDSFYRVLEMDADAALAYLQGMLTVTTQTEDAAEGVAAFAEKRAPVWKGR